MSLLGRKVNSENKHGIANSILFYAPFSVREMVQAHCNLHVSFNVCYISLRVQIQREIGKVPSPSLWHAIKCLQLTSQSQLIWCQKFLNIHNERHVALISAGCCVLINVEISLSAVLRFSCCLQIASHVRRSFELARLWKPLLDLSACFPFAISLHDESAINIGTSIEISYQRNRKAATVFNKYTLSHDTSYW